MGLLSAAGIVAGYSAADQVLKGVAIDVAPGEIVAIIGPNGAGKSTLLKSIAGMVRVGGGAITFADAAITNWAPRRITAHGLAFVPQEANVFPSMTVRENLEIGGYLVPGQANARIAEIFARFPELAEKRRKAARTLSGGQRQILAMAMALMVAPKLLLLDEPSAGLSPVAAERLFDTIRDINKSGVAIAMVEQNALEALNIADRAYLLVDGRNARDGRARDLAGDPEIRRLFLGG